MVVSAQFTEVTKLWNRNHPFSQWPLCSVMLSTQKEVKDSAGHTRADTSARSPSPATINGSLNFRLVK